MSVGLSSENNSWWQAFIAHSQRVGLVVRAVVLDLVAKTVAGRAVLALLVRQMLVLAFLLLLNQEVFEALMFDELLPCIISQLLVIDHFDFLFLFLDDWLECLSIVILAAFLLFVFLVDCLDDSA